MDSIEAGTAAPYTKRGGEDFSILQKETFIIYLD